MRKSTRILALDVGDRWIGVAMSDPGGILATPLTVIDRAAGTGDLEVIRGIVRDNDVGTVVVGLPRAMDGSIKQQAEKVQDFARRLSNATPVPIEFRDERLSTVSALRLMRESGARRQKKKVRDDAAAAAVILQAYLDEKAQLSGDDSAREDVRP